MSEGAAGVRSGAGDNARSFPAAGGRVELHLVGVAPERRELRQGVALLALWGSLVGGALSVLATAVSAV